MSRTALDRMFHQDLGVVFDQCGLTGVAEHVAAGHSTGRAAVKASMNSAGHRANLLTPAYKTLGWPYVAAPTARRTPLRCSAAASLPVADGDARPRHG